MTCAKLDNVQEFSAFCENGSPPDTTEEHSVFAGRRSFDLNTQRRLGSPHPLFCCRRAAFNRRSGGTRATPWSLARAATGQERSGGGCGGQVRVSAAAAATDQWTAALTCWLPADAPLRSTEGTRAGGQGLVSPGKDHNNDII